MIINYATSTLEIKSRIAMAKSEIRIFHQQIGLKFKEETRKCYIFGTALYGAETWTLLKVDQTFVESFEMWCCRRT
jgi:hypothetical protein